MDFSLLVYKNTVGLKRCKFGLLRVLRFAERNWYWEAQQLDGVRARVSKMAMKLSTILNVVFSWLVVYLVAVDL